MDGPFSEHHGVVVSVGVVGASAPRLFESVAASILFSNICLNDEKYPKGYKQVTRLALVRMNYFSVYPNGLWRSFYFFVEKSLTFDTLHERKYPTLVTPYMNLENLEIFQLFGIFHTFLVFYKIQVPWNTFHNNNIYLFCCEKIKNQKKS